MTGRFSGRARPTRLRIEERDQSPDGPERLVEDAVSTFGGLDTFVNHVGPVRPHTGGFHSGSDDY
jgi:hypothetical protein